MTIVPAGYDEGLRANTDCGKTKAQPGNYGAGGVEQAELGMNTAGSEINQERVFVSARPLVKRIVIDPVLLNQTEVNHSTEHY